MGDFGVSTIRVEVILASPDQIWRKSVTLPAGANVASAIQASGLAAAHPKLFAQPLSTGVFGVSCAQTQVLNDGDRVEIYRPLHFDPKESRRRRALHRKSVKIKGSPPRRRVQINTTP
jgi:hypothetical protein